MNTEWLKDTIRLVKKRKRVEAAALLLVNENENLTRFGENRITQNTTRHRIQLQVTAVHQKRRAMSETSDISGRGVLAALRKAETIVKLTPEDPEFVDLPGPQRYTAVKRFYEQTANLTVEAKAGIIRKQMAEAEAREITASGIFRSGDYGFYTANTAGLLAEHVWTDAEFSLTAQSSDASGSAQGQDEDVSKIDPEALAAEAFRYEELGRNPRELKPGAYPTLLTARSLAELMPFMVEQMDRRAADEGRSFFTKKLGKKILSSKIDISADPKDRSNPSLPIDLYNDGINRKKAMLVEKGVLQNLWCRRYWAKKNRVPLVSPAFAFSMSGGTKNLEELVAKMDRGLLVMQIWYIRYVNPMDLILTGTSRDGLFWVEEGRIKHAVRHMRFNESPMRMLRNPSALGLPERRQGSMLLPSVLVNDFNWASGTTF